MQSENDSGARRRIKGGSPWEDKAGYSRAVVDGRWCFVAGTTGYDPAIDGFAETAADQTRTALEIIERALAEAGFALTDVVRARYYLADRGDVDAVMDVLGEAFGSVRPAATMVLCQMIEPAIKVEIEVTALRQP